ncbi:MAG TPA: pyridoxal phosphate-dependent aminotransferase [Polyangiales bacterium]|nr:pyridoxal phosphate-dependent aminotransferase [Polyangiales bacterium]
MFVVNPVVFGDDLTFALGREVASRKARGESCVDATVGVLMDNDGELAVLPTVVDVFRETPPAEWAAYAATTGLDGFCEAVIEDCLFGRPTLREHAVAIATPGATGALRTALRTFLDRNQAFLTTSLTWSAYPIIAQATERRLIRFRMFRDGHQGFDVEDLDRELDRLMAMQGRALVLLNDPCNNPTGYTMSRGDWLAVAEVLERHSKRGPIAVVLDAVYGAFAPEGLNPALDALEPLADQVLLTIAWSASKTFTCYGLRAGALVAIAPDRAVRNSVRDTIACHCCGTWANCNRGALAALIRLLQEPRLRAAVACDREVFIDLLAQRSAAFEQAIEEHALCRPTYKGGFFTSVFVPEAAQVASVLRDEGVYVVPLEGAVRIALSAVRSDDLPRLVTALARAVERGGRRYSGVRSLGPAARPARRANGR